MLLQSDMSKIKSYKDLNVWKESHKLTIQIYTITKNFPKDEIFGVISQMRRASSSVGANIAEGHSRYTKKEINRYYTISLGSLFELENFVLLSRDLEYIEIEVYKMLENQIILCRKLLFGSIRVVNEKLEY